MPEFVIGLNAKVYRNTGSWGTPTWVEVTNIQDVSLAMEAGEFAGNTRGSKWKKFARTLLEAGVELNMLHKPGYAGQVAIRNAFLDGTLIDLAIMDGAITTSGNEGLRAEMAVLSYNREEPLEEGLTVSSTVKPGISANEPEWKVVP